MNTIKPFFTGVFFERGREIGGEKTAHPPMLFLTPTFIETHVPEHDAFIFQHVSRDFSVLLEANEEINFMELQNWARIGKVPQSLPFSFPSVTAEVATGTASELATTQPNTYRKVQGWSSLFAFAMFVDAENVSEHLTVRVVKYNTTTLKHLLVVFRINAVSANYPAQFRITMDLNARGGTRAMQTAVIGPLYVGQRTRRPGKAHVAPQNIPATIPAPIARDTELLEAILQEVKGLRADLALSRTSPFPGNPSPATDTSGLGGNQGDFFGGLSQGLFSPHTTELDFSNVMDGLTPTSDVDHWLQSAWN